MIYNFERIKPMFYFNEGNGMYFHCQIVQRAKDHPDKKVKEGAIATYIIRSRDHLDILKEEIIALCELKQARAYINLSAKDFNATNKLMLSMLANYNIHSEIDWINPKKILNSALGSTISRNPKWIVDVDNPEDKQSIWDYLSSKVDIHNEIPTVQCCHFITDKFDLQAFKEKFPHIDVHKNSMGTLLYYPNSISNG